jgi:hypothetical protein
VNIKTSIFWFVPQSSKVNRYKCFVVNRFLRLQCRTRPEDGGSSFLRKARNSVPDYKVSHLRIHQRFEGADIENKKADWNKFHYECYEMALVVAIGYSDTNLCPSLLPQARILLNDRRESAKLCVKMLRNKQQCKAIFQFGVYSFFKCLS